MGELTTLTKATSKSGSLRTTVPKGIVRHFDMAERDRLEWTMKVKKSKLTIEVSHIRAEGSKTKPNPGVRERKLAKKSEEKPQDDPKSGRRWKLR